MQKKNRASVIIKSARLFLFGRTTNEKTSPIRAIGNAVKVILDEVIADTDRFYSEINIDNELRILGDPSITDEQIINSFFSIIKLTQIGNLGFFTKKQ